MTTPADLLAMGQAKHGGAAQEAKRHFIPLNPVRASRWKFSSNGAWRMDPKAKLVHFIRHGQGYHNLVAAVSRDLGAVFPKTDDYNDMLECNCPYLLPALEDPPLTSVGISEAKSLRSTARVISPELFVVSPMRRATQTILLAFQDVIAKNPHIPILAHEGCREKHGVNLCDKRSPILDLKEHYPSVDYRLIADDVDTMWQTKHRETMLEMAQRADCFVQWLLDRREKEIVVGTHGAWLMALCNVALDIQLGDNQIPGNGDDATKIFATGELRSLILSRTPASNKLTTNTAASSSLPASVVTLTVGGSADQSAESPNKRQRSN